MATLTKNFYQVKIMTAGGPDQLSSSVQNAKVLNDPANFVAFNGQTSISSNVPSINVPATINVGSLTVPATINIPRRSPAQQSLNTFNIASTTIPTIQ